MDRTNGMSDAEMRLITVNGQTIMLEGDFENINITNEFLNEMVMVSNSKVDINQECNVDVDGNLCINSEKKANEEAPKLQISIQGENNELEMVQIGVEDAKALGLCFQEYKNNDICDTLNCPPNELIQTSNTIEENINGRSEEEGHEVKLHSVPLMNVGCLGKEQNTVFYLNDVTKANETSELNSDNYPFCMEPKEGKGSKNFPEDTADGLHAIGHLEGFQIPTSEEKLLLPATVNAKMVDGSYQTITLVPQVVDGAVTYTVHFSNLSRDILDRNIRSPDSTKDTEEINDEPSKVKKEELSSNEITSVENFLNPVQSIKTSQMNAVTQENNGSIDSNNLKTSITDFHSCFSDSCISKVNSDNCEDTKTSDMSVNYNDQNQVAIDTKIDNLISENENVISKFKKVKYGKNVNSSAVDSKLEGAIKILKNNISKTKKVKFKGKSLKLFSDALDKNKQKLSLLKANNEHKFEVFKNRGSESEKMFNGVQMPHMNLNGRLEYPNLKAIDETPSLSYLKAKSSQATKQPYFNVLPYPKTKTTPIQKQILPLNCDPQQAKNLISLQKFLETQKLQLKIQPLSSNGNKVLNIKPKPTVNEENKRTTSINSQQLYKKLIEKHSNSEISKEVKTQENEYANKSYPNHVNIKEVLLNNGKFNNLKFLKPQSPKPCEKDTLKQVSTECTNKFNGIFIKNNPEYFSQKTKDKREEHPLGSSENPIQLVQTGHTFHSRQPLSEAQLQQIASILQKQKFNSPSVTKNSIFDPKTNTRIVYRVVYPEDVEMKDAEKEIFESVNIKKRGKHKGKFGGGEEDVQKKTTQMSRGPGRPKKSGAFMSEDDILEEEIEDPLPKKKIPRTRSGRLSRPPRYMVKDYRRLHNSDTSEKIYISNYELDEIYSSYKSGEKVSLDGRSDNLSNLEINSNLLPGLRPQQRSKRNFKPEYRCPTCQKIYLGHTRMMWHLNKFPDHCNVEKYKENYYRKRTETKVRRAARRLNACHIRAKIKQVLSTMAKDELISSCGPPLADALTTWDFLLLRVNLLKNNRKDEVDALIHELILLLEKLSKVAEDIFLPVFTKESEKDEDCVEIDRMEVAIALGLPVGFYKVNNHNLNLLRHPLTKTSQNLGGNCKSEYGNEGSKAGSESLFSNEGAESKLNEERKANSWEELGEGKGKNDSFWLEGKRDETSWHDTEEPVKTLSTKFEPNLSSKLLESSNDSIDDGKYEEAVPLMNLDQNSKDVDHSNSPETLIESPDIILDKGEEKLVGERSSRPVGSETKPSLWTENSGDKASEDLWTEGAVETKSSELWSNENSNMAVTSEKPDDSHLWNDNSKLTVGEKVDQTNSEFLESLLSVPNSNEFLDGNSTRSFLSENISFEEKSSEETKSDDPVEEKGKRKWETDDGDDSSYIRVWNANKSSSWQKDESILSGTIQPGVRTGARLPSTPESNGNVPFAISTRRNSISDFSNINLDSNNLDVVLPSAKTLMKDCLKTSELKESSFLEGTENYKVKDDWDNDSRKPTFNSTSVHSEDLMKMALESLTSQHDVINVPPTGFDSAIGILNQNQETGNLNLFTPGEPDADALDFNLPLPDHLLRENFAPCEQGEASTFQNGGSSSSFSLVSNTNNIFVPNCTLPNPIKFDEQFETNFSAKKSKSLDDVMEFFDAKTSFNGFETGSGSSGMNHFSFSSDPSQSGEYQVSTASPVKKKKARTKKQGGLEKRIRKPSKKAKGKKAVDYPKGNSIESIINEALFESSKALSLQINHSSPNSNSTIASSTENYSLPIISGALDEVENLDFLSQD